MHTLQTPRQKGDGRGFGLRPAGFALVAWVALTFSGTAGVAVNSPSTITHRVIIQPVITRTTDGTTAMYFGSATSEAYIKDQIDEIWAQSGVVIEWLPATSYTNNFAYDGRPTNYSSSSRPTSHLGTIVNGAPAPPRSPDATVLSMFFVEICPGFNQTSDNTANGLAYVDGNGSTVHVGANLVTWTAGRDVVASVVAHEIGHNLGLGHSSGNGRSDNLMTPGSNEERLLASQTDTIFQNNSGIDGYDVLKEFVAESNYTQWANLGNLSEGPQGDDDKDGISNVIEFMLGLRGNQYDQLPPMTAGPNGLTWTLPKSAGALADGLTYAIEVSNDGSNWIEAGYSTPVGHTVVTDDASELSVRVDPDQGFVLMRLAALIPPELEAASRTFVPLEALDQQGKKPAISLCSHGSCGCKTVALPSKR